MKGIRLAIRGVQESLKDFVELDGFSIKANALTIAQARLDDSLKRLSATFGEIFAPAVTIAAEVVANLADMLRDALAPVVKFSFEAVVIGATMAEFAFKRFVTSQSWRLLAQC